MAARPGVDPQGLFKMRDSNLGRIIPRVRIASLSGTRVLSFDEFDLDISARLTTIVGPNGAGKSNVARLLEICRRAIECADGAASDVDQMLAAFVAAHHVYSRSPGLRPASM
jgi:ABC-type polysaccharide/polyol phosphate transport system ATPase subunit